MDIPRALCWTIIFFGAGCGLSDYESRMDEQRERLRAYDEQAKYLGVPLELPGPANSESSAPIPFRVDMQLPKGISGAIASDEGLFESGKLLVARYPGADGFNIFISGVFAASPDEAKEEKRGWLPAEFQEGFQSELGKILGRNFKSFQPVERITRQAGWKPGRRATEKPREIAFDYLSLGDEPETVHVDVYFHQDKHRLVGLAFQVPAKQKEDRAVQLGIDAAVRSLEVGPMSASR